VRNPFHVPLLAAAGIRLTISVAGLRCANYVPRSAAGFHIPVLKLRERKPVMNDMTELHQALAKVVVGDRELSETLTEITGIARRAMPSVEAASVTLIRGEKAFTAAYDGQMALDADEMQYERGYGPCLDAGRAGQMFLVDDMRSEQRWPDYAQNVTAHGVLSSLSVPLPFQGATIGAQHQPVEGFDDTDIELAQEVAAWIATAVGNAEAAARTSDDLIQLHTAMRSRACIEQAKGILMERHKITEDEAFTMLTHASQRFPTNQHQAARNRLGAGPDRCIAQSKFTQIQRDSIITPLPIHGASDRSRLSG
jgi:ANTAR domain/GAF domain